MDISNRYSTAQISNDTGLTPATIREWCRRLEKLGYEIEKDHNDNRLFTDENRIVLLTIKKIKSEKKLTLNSAITEILSHFEEYIAQHLDLETINKDVVTPSLNQQNQSQEIALEIYRRIKRGLEQAQEDLDLLKRILKIDE